MVYMKIIFIVIIAISLFCLGGCADKVKLNDISFNLFKIAGDKDACVIEKLGIMSDEWDKVIIVFGFADDYTIAQDIAQYLREDGGQYRVVSLK